MGGILSHDVGFRPTPAEPKPVVSHAKQRPRSVLVSSTGRGRTQQDRSYATLWQGIGNLGCPTRRARCDALVSSQRAGTGFCLIKPRYIRVALYASNCLGHPGNVVHCLAVVSANLLAAIFADSDVPVGHRGATRPAYKQQRVYCMCGWIPFCLIVSMSSPGAR